jgi:rhamnogalacturonan endolyase
MNLRPFALILAGQLLLAGVTAVFANDPGGGTNGVGADVTLTDNGGTVTLANGIVTATINKDSGKITSLLYRGFQTVQSGGNIYYSMDGSPEYRDMNNCVYSIKTNTADMVDVSFRQNWTVNTNYTQAFDIEAHWVLRRGDSGVYAYAILDHPANYPTTTVSEWRMVWKLPNDFLERVYVDELRHWQQPSYADIQTAEATSISEIVKLTTGVRAGRYDGKYQYSAEYENIGTWGHASNVKNIGTWIVTGNYEYFNDGPTKNDLCNDWEYQLIHFGRNHFNPSGANDTHGTAGVTWQKIYGPFLLYLNYDPAGGDACWADAKSQVQAESGAWPYTWLTGNTNYPLADARGAASGRFLASDTLKAAVSTSNAWVGLTDPSVDWQFDSDHYQYWVRAAADG